MQLINNLQVLLLLKQRRELQGIVSFYMQPRLTFSSLRASFLLLIYFSFLCVSVFSFLQSSTKLQVVPYLLCYCLYERVPFHLFITGEIICIRIFIAVLPIHSTLNIDLDDPTLSWLGDLHVLILILELLDEHDVKQKQNPKFTFSSLEHSRK